MPPVPITILSNPNTSYTLHSKPPTLSFAYKPSSTSSAFKQNPAKAGESSKSSAASTPSPPTTTTVAPAQNGSDPDHHTSSSTTNNATASVATGPCRRRKTHHTAPSGQVASLTPLLQPIVNRCLPHSQVGSPASGSGTTPLPSPPHKRGPGGRKHHNHAAVAARALDSWNVIHPYSRAWDTTNDRSTNPSPREIAMMEKQELEKVKVREESAALARAAAAAKRRKGKSRAGSRNNGNGTGTGTGTGTNANAHGTRSASPSQKDRVEVEADFSGGAVVPTITTEPASNANSPTSSTTTPAAPGSSSNNTTAIHPRAGLKRTRSIGLGISTANANNATGSSIAVGSPLRSVTGPNSPEGDDDDEAGGRDAKRSRLNPTDADGAATVMGGVGGRMTRRASSGSPIINSQSLSLSPTVPLASVTPSGTATTGTIGTGTGRRSSATGLTSEATAMRRAVSATTLAQQQQQQQSGGKAMTRSGSMGAAAGPGGDAAGLLGDAVAAGKERARREVTLPGRLRDYEMRAGTAS